MFQQKIYMRVGLIILRHSTNLDAESEPLVWDAGEGECFLSWFLKQAPFDGHISKLFMDRASHDTYIHFTGLNADYEQHQ